MICDVKLGQFIYFNLANVNTHFWDTQNYIPVLLKIEYL